MESLSFTDLAKRLCRDFTSQDISDDDLDVICNKSFQCFQSKGVILCMMIFHALLLNQM